MKLKKLLAAICTAAVFCTAPLSAFSYDNVLKLDPSNVGITAKAANDSQFVGEWELYKRDENGRVVTNDDYYLGLFLNIHADGTGFLYEYGENRQLISRAELTWSNSGDTLTINTHYPDSPPGFGDNTSSLTLTNDGLVEHLSPYSGIDWSVVHYYRKISSSPHVETSTTATTTATTTTTTTTTNTTTTTTTTTTAATTTTVPVYTGTIYPGDVNLDGYINARDASVVMYEYAALALKQSSVLPYSNLTPAADVDENGVINAVDARHILSYYAYMGTGGTDSFLDYMKKLTRESCDNTEAELSLSQITVDTDDEWSKTQKITLSIKGNGAKIDSGGIRILLDPALKPMYDDYSGIGSCILSEDETTNSLFFVFVSERAKIIDSEDKMLLSFYVELPNGIQPGKYPITIAYEDGDMIGYSQGDYSDKLSEYAFSHINQGYIEVKGTPTTTTAEGNVSDKIGDANCDGKTSVADAVAILQYIGNRDKYKLSETGLKNADVDGIAGITGKDALVIQQVDAGLYKLEDLPLKTK